MDDRDVAEVEMRWFRPHRDEIDAVVGDDLLDDDLADVAAIVHDLRSAYLRDEPVPRHPALLAFTASPLDENGEPLVTAVSNAHGSAPQMAGLPNRDDTTGRNPKMLSTLTALLAPAAAKIALGTALAAASVGGLEAADVVDLVPDEAETQVTTSDEEREERDVAEQDELQTTDHDADDQTHEGDGGFSEEMELWSSCVEEESAAHDGTAPFDPFEACGDEHARYLAPGQDNRPEDVPAGPEDTPAAVAPESTPTGPEDTPADDTPAADRPTPPAQAGEDTGGSVESQERDGEAPAEAGPPADAGSQGADRP